MALWHAIHHNALRCQCISTNFGRLVAYVYSQLISERPPPPPYFLALRRCTPPPVDIVRVVWWMTLEVYKLSARRWPALDLMTSVRCRARHAMGCLLAELESASRMSWEVVIKDLLWCRPGPDRTMAYTPYWPAHPYINPYIIQPNLLDHPSVGIHDNDFRSQTGHLEVHMTRLYTCRQVDLCHHGDHSPPETCVFWFRSGSLDAERLVPAQHLISPEGGVGAGGHRSRWQGVLPHLALLSKPEEKINGPGGGGIEGCF